MALALTGCATTPAADSSAPPADETVSSDTEAKEDTQLLVYCWDEEFKGMFTDYYLKDHPLPDGVTYEFVINSNEGDEYQNRLDEAILAGEPIDIFLVEAENAVKYVESYATRDILSLGVKETDLANQYDYTRKIATDSAGILKGSSFRASPGLFVYRRSIAQDIFGTDDPAEMQALLSDWARFETAAEKVKDESGGDIAMLFSYRDTYMAFSNNATVPWVDLDYKIQIDENIWKWVDQTKAFADKGYIAHPEDSEASVLDGNAFGFFCSEWGVNFPLNAGLAQAGEDGGKPAADNGFFGDWAAVVGPAPYYAGGVWLCAGVNGNNDELVADIIRYCTCDTAAMETYCKDTGDFVNNRQSITNVISGGSSFSFLGGQDHFSLLADVAAGIRLSPVTPYDQGCNQSFQAAFEDYFTGAVKTKEEALENFYLSALAKYPNLTD